MCGIYALINLRSASSTEPIVKGTEVIAHRGPDDEGYLFWDGGDTISSFGGRSTAKGSRAAHSLESLPENTRWDVGMGHRRLSIIDLSPAGHQPMVDHESGLAVVYNGEIYNYRELRNELELKGHRFRSNTDTEVLLRAWKEWNEYALHHFNGMFSFVILDTKSGKLFAVRDRFAIKPLYYAIQNDYIAFASEIKQIRTLPGFRTRLNESIIYDYLARGLLDHRPDTFDKQINQLRGGQMASLDLKSLLAEHESPMENFKIRSWYHLKPTRWQGTKEEANASFRELFRESVKLRLRADVPVGSCLSGGLDSSAIVCQAAALLEENGDHKGQKTVTASYQIPKYDEWEYASLVIGKTNSTSYRIWPTSDKLIEDLDQLIYFMDEPFGSTSQFSQWSVFEGAADAGLKVMLDGQGADEMLAGYGGNDVALYAGLLRRGDISTILNNYFGFKKELGYAPKGQLLHAIGSTFPIIDSFLPSRNHRMPRWINTNAISSDYMPVSTYSLRDEMIQQTTVTSLPALLRYEDRNSMAFSIESRVPFLDYHLVEFLIGLPESYLYHKGIRKVVLRQALRSLVPDRVMERRDKMGFVTPEEVWLKGEKKNWFMDQVLQAAKFSGDWIINKEAIEMTQDIIDGRKPFTFEPWRILCFGRWLKQMNA